MARHSLMNRSIPTSRANEAIGIVGTAERVAARVMKPAPVTPAAPLEDRIATAGKYHGVDPNLSLAVAHAESSLNSNAVSSDGHSSKGVFQLLDDTGKYLHEEFGLSDRYDPFDPSQNSYIGIGYLKKLQAIFRERTNLGFGRYTMPVKSSADLEKVAVAAFNAGEGAVQRAQQKAHALGANAGSYDSIAPYLPASTRSYVEKVSSMKIQLAKNETEKSIG